MSEGTPERYLIEGQFVDGISGPVVEASNAADQAVTRIVTSFDKLSIAGASMDQLRARATELAGALAEVQALSAKGFNVTAAAAGGVKTPVDKLREENALLQQEIQTRTRLNQQLRDIEAETGARFLPGGGVITRGPAPYGTQGVDPNLLSLAQQEPTVRRIGTGQTSPIFLSPEGARAVGLNPDAAGIYDIHGTRISANEKDPAGFREQALSAQLSRIEEREAAAMGGGGGFFGGFGSGLSGGGKGGQGFGNTEELGKLVGYMARYILLYQVFRDIEKIIRESVDQMLNFERSVSDLANQLGVTREEARGLANDLALQGAASGLLPNQSVELGAQFATTFSGQGDPAALARQGVSLGGMLHVLTGGKEDAQYMRDVTGITQSFNLSISDTARVLDAATSAAQHFGLGNAGTVLPGLAQIGDLANQAGFSVEFMANALADIQQRTGQSSPAAAGELQRFLGREGNLAFQQVFASQGINTTQPFQDELEQLSERYDKLSQSEKAFIIGQFGGGRAGADALAFLEDYAKIQEQANRSTEQGGISQEQYFKRIEDVRGELTALRGILANFAKDIGESGVLAPLGLILETLKPTVQAADELVQAFNQIPAPLREAAALVGEIALAAKITTALNLGAMFRRGGAAAAVEGEAAAAGAAEAEVAAASTGRWYRNRTLGAGRIPTQDLRAATLGEDAAFGASLRGGLGYAALGVKGMASQVAESLGQLINPLTLTIGGFIAIDHALHTTEGILDASNKAAEATLSGVSANQLTSSSEANRRAAVEAAHSSSGFFGTIINSVLGNPTGQARQQARANADLADWESKQYTAALNAGASTQTLAESLVDLGNAQDGVQLSVKALTAAGYTATQSIQALIDKLEATALVSEGTIPAGQAPAVARAAANAATNSFRNDVLLDRELQSFQPTGATLDVVENARRAANRQTDVPAPPVDPSKLSKVNYKEFNDAIYQATLGYLTDQGLSPTQQGTLSPEQLKAEQARILQAMKDDLAKQGVDAKTIQALVPDLNREAAEAVHQQLQGVAGGVTQLSSKQIIDLINNVQQLSGQAAAEAAAHAQFDPKNVTPTGVVSRSGAQAGAEQTVRFLQEVRQGIIDNKNISATDKANDLNYLATLTEQAQVAAENATLQNLQANQALALASIPPENTTQAIRQKLADITSTLADPTLHLTAEEIRGLKTAQAQLGAQLPGATLADRVSGIGVDTNPADTVQIARDAEHAANRTLTNYRNRGVVGKALHDAEKAVTQAHYQTVLAEQQDAIDTADSLVPVMDKVGEAYQAWQDALTKAQTLVGGARQKQLHDAMTLHVQFLQTQQEQTNAIVLAGIDPRDTAALDRQKLRNDRANLRILRQNAPDDLTDIANLETQQAQDRITALTHRIASQNARRDAGVRAGNSLQEARAGLRDAQNNLRDDLVGSDEYYADLKAVHEAEAGLASEIAAHTKELYLLRGDTTDPVEQARANLVEARRKLREDQRRGTGDLAADNLNVEQADWARQKAVFDQTLSGQQTAYQLHRESAQSYLQFLENQDRTLRDQLRGMHKGQEGYRQLVDELNVIDQAILGMNDQLSGQFNLGNIDVPTVYDVRRQLASGQQSIIDASQHTNNVSINGVDINQVINYINHILGVRGTSARTPSANRKVA
jgi:hypothetical protein